MCMIVFTIQFSSCKPSCIVAIRMFCSRVYIYRYTNSLHNTLPGVTVIGSSIKSNNVCRSIDTKESGHGNSGVEYEHYVKCVNVT